VSSIFNWRSGAAQVIHSPKIIMLHIKKEEKDPTKENYISEGKRIMHLP